MRWSTVSHAQESAKATVAVRIVHIKLSCNSRSCPSSLSNVGLRSGEFNNTFVTGKHNNNNNQSRPSVFYLQDKRISVIDALAHPYLDEGRLRYHSCMCKCCYNTSGGMRQYTADFEPAATQPFDDLWERKLTSVQQVKGEKNYKLHSSSSAVLSWTVVDGFFFLRCSTLRSGWLQFAILLCIQLFYFILYSLSLSSEQRKCTNSLLNNCKLAAFHFA